MSEEIKRRGRPTKAPVEGERVPLSLRVTAELKRDLDRSAEAVGRSLSQEAEIRLERSFADEAAFPSSNLRFWAIYLAAVFHRKGSVRAAEKGKNSWTDKEWMNDPDCRLVASFDVIDSLINDLVRQPGADLDAISLYIESLKSRFINNVVSSGKAKLEMKDEDDAR